MYLLVLERKSGGAFIEGVDQGMRDARFGLYETARWIARSTKAVLLAYGRLIHHRKLVRPRFKLCWEHRFRFKDKAEEVTKQATQLATK